MKRIGIVVAGGSGQRMGAQIPKQFLDVNLVPILIRTLHKFIASTADQIVLVLPENQFENWFKLKEFIGFDAHVLLVAGGKTRFESVSNALKCIETKEEDALVAIHDAVRPFVSSQLIDDSFEQAKIHGSAVAAIQLKDSIRLVIDEHSSQAKDRSKYKLTQTPQTFNLLALKSAYLAVENGDLFTDDASVWEHSGKQINLIAGEELNFKITTPEDLKLAESLSRFNPDV